MIPTPAPACLRQATMHHNSPLRSWDSQRLASPTAAAVLAVISRRQAQVWG